MPISARMRPMGLCHSGKSEKNALGIAPPKHSPLTAMYRRGKRVIDRGATACTALGAFTHITSWFDRYGTRFNVFR